MSVFTALPQDMLQWEIARFLTHKDALNWNEVLKKDERIFKKLPTDYAIKHQIHLSHQGYQDIAWKLQLSLGRVGHEGPDGEVWPSLDVPKSVKLLRKYFAFFKDPKNHVVLMYIKGRKARFLENIGQWTELDMELYESLSETEVEELRDEAFDVLNLVADVPFVRDVPVKDYKNAFAA
jgi:hypothetical protein